MMVRNSSDSKSIRRRSATALIVFTMRGRGRHIDEFCSATSGTELAQNIWTVDTDSIAINNRHSSLALTFGTRLEHCLLLLRCVGHGRESVIVFSRLIISINGHTHML